MSNLNEYQEAALKVLSKHEYTLLTKKSDNEVWKDSNCEIWHCGNGASSSYAFDIAIMPMGIAVSGDIGKYTFDVYNRGMDFLAGRDVDYYIHSKLSRHCRIEDFISSKFEEIIKDYVIIEFENNSELDDDFASSLLKECNEKDFDCLKNYIEKAYFDEEKELNDKTNELIDNLYNFFERAVVVNHDQEAHDLLYSCEFMEFTDSFECCFTDVSSGLSRVLYMINHAAKEIMKIKNS